MRATTWLRPALLGQAFVALTMIIVAPADAQDKVTLSITMKDRKFDPPELHAPPGQPIAIRVKNLNPIASEFESNDLHVEKIVSPGAEVTVNVRPLQPGRYTFFDDFHRETQGYLIVP